MRHRQTAFVIACTALIGFLGGCASNRPQQYTKFANAFLPAPPVAAALDAPPAIASVDTGLYSHEAVSLLAQSAPRSSQANECIRTAELHFEAGRRLYEEGDAKGARNEFDAAIDALLTAPANMPDRQKLEAKLEQLSEAIFRYDAEGLGAGRQSGQIVYDRPPLEGILETTFPVDPNLKPKVRGELDATVSQLPLELRDPVLSFVHYFSTDRGHKTLAAGLRRAGRYRAMIESVLQEEGIPLELIYLAQDESGFLPRAKSVKSCIGLWQFAQFRGREYGLTQTAAVDERMDPEKATRAAAHHLHDLYRHFGDWYLAMAAYDCGPGCVDRAVERTGYADFWELHRLNALPKETMNYVPLILAMTIMAKNPKDYALDDVQPDAPLETNTVEMKAPTSLALAADALGSSVPELQDLNPSLLKPVAPLGFALRIPMGAQNRLTAGLGQVPLERRATWRLHRVEAGESLAMIAKRFGSAPNLLEAANTGSGAGAAPGDLLVVPVANRAVVAATPRASRSAHGARYARKSKSRSPRNAARPAHGKAYATASLHAPRKRASIDR